MKRLLSIVLPALAACAGAPRAAELVPIPEGVYRVVGTVGTTGVDGQLVVAENVALIARGGTCVGPATPEARREAARTRTLTLECGYRVVLRWDERGELSATGGAPVTTERVVGRQCEVWNTDRLGRNTTCRRWTDVVRTETHWQMAALAVERVRD